LQGQIPAILRNEVVGIMSGTVFVFIGLVACAAACVFAVVRRQSGVRLFAWLGIWSAMYGVLLLADSPSLVAALPRWVRSGVPFLTMAIDYMFLVVVSLAWLELSAGKMRVFLKTIIGLGLTFGIAGIVFFVVTGSVEKLLPYVHFIAAAALIIFVVILAVPGLSRKYLILPNRAVMIIGTLVFATDALYFNVARLFHYPAYRITGSVGLAALLFSFGYVGVQIALSGERRLHSIESELAIAQEIQASILPGKNPEVKNLLVAAVYRPMTAVAGDFYDFIAVDENRTGFLVADVTGHGVPAALIASMIKVAIQSLVACAHNPGEVMSGLNRILSSQLRAQLVSAAYLWIDMEKRRALYSAAGHPPLLHWREGKLERVESNGLLLGVLPDAEYPVRDMAIQAGDRFLLYTDGVSEPENRGGEAFGEHRLEQVVRDNRLRAPSEFLEQLLSEIHKWEPASTEQKDDITLVVIDVLS
jgi:sigma-B regulation protein RsbU (phosphoserine phosphatase)